MKAIIAVPATLALVYRAYTRNSLTFPGILVAVATAAAHAVHPWSVFFALLCVFFLAGTAVTKVKHEVKARLTHSSTGSPGGEGPRNHIQVLANSLVASILILLHAWQLHHEDSSSEQCWPYGGSVLVVGIIANYAAVAADTFSSELGILSSSRPRLITAPWRSVPPGTNGGVTPIGLLAGAAGALVIALTAATLLPFCASTYSRTKLFEAGVSADAGWNLESKAAFVAAVTLIGLCGSLLDSFLGATLQASVLDVRTGKVIEGAGGGKVPVHSQGSFHMKQQAKVRGAVSRRSEGAGAVAKTSAVEKEDPAVRARTAERAGGIVAGAGVGGDEGHESRTVVVGRDVLSNNGVNFTMAGLMSLGAMVGACVVWGVPFSSLLS